MSAKETHVLRASQIKRDPVDYVLTADPPMRAELAARFGLPNIAKLRGAFTLEHERGGRIAAKLHMSAHVTQICVVTLEPFDAVVDEHADLRFVPKTELKDNEEVVFDPHALDGPDEIPIEGDRIDLAEALAEQLALSLDPFPRIAGAQLPESGESNPAHPFAALQAGKLEN